MLSPIIGELSKKEPNQGVSDWISDIEKISVSAITIEEIYYFDAPFRKDEDVNGKIQA